jgi:RNA polymerase sigma-70 factor (ECF subfamily)
MNTDFDVRTDKSLLAKVRVFEDRRAWSRFMKAYLPMIRAWGKRFGLSQEDVEEITSRLLAKLVEALPRFDYDPAKGTFRGWLKTVTQRELATFARERRRRIPDAGLLFEQADDVDGLVASLQPRYEEQLPILRDALKEVHSEVEGEEQKSWEVFQRIVVAGQAIEPVAAEFGLTYHAAAMRVQRIKKKVRNRTLQLAVQRGLTLAA